MSINPTTLTRILEHSMQLANVKPLPDGYSPETITTLRFRLSDVGRNALSRVEIEGWEGLIGWLGQEASDDSIREFCLDATSRLKQMKTEPANVRCSLVFGFMLDDKVGVRMLAETYLTAALKLETNGGRLTLNQQANAQIYLTHLLSGMRAHHPSEIIPNIQSSLRPLANKLARLGPETLSTEVLDEMTEILAAAVSHMTLMGFNDSTCSYGISRLTKQDLDELYTLMQHRQYPRTVIERAVVSSADPILRAHQLNAVYHDTIQYVGNDLGRADIAQTAAHHVVLHHSQRDTTDDHRQKAKTFVTNYRPKPSPMGPKRALATLSRR